MKLSDFIRNNLEPILNEWEQFARSIQPARDMDATELRDHALRMLQWIAEDLDCAQTEEEQREKSKGRGLQITKEDVAGTHGSERLEAGFDVSEVMSEYRALRASVVRLWGRTNTKEKQSDIYDLTRFNEAIDQALSESIDRYSSEKEQHTRLFDALLTASPDHNYVLDLDGRFIYANKALTDSLEMSLSELIGKDFFDLSINNATDIRKQLQRVVDTGEKCRGEMSYSFASKSDATYEYVFSPVMDGEAKVEAIAGTARDVTERKASEERTWRIANYDVLTGLPNRRLFRDRLEQNVRQAERTGAPIAVLFIDLDAFKEVNDLLGHDAGDLLLQQAANRISACVRGADTVARLGGDEFTVVLPEISKVEHVELRAQEILDQLAKPFHILQRVVHVSGSIGITLFPQDATTSENLVRNADQAMYVAKSEGRNRFCFFTASMRDSAWARLKVIDELRQALPQGQLTVYYQPIIDLSDGDIVKAEALLRWRHPQRGLVLPRVFIEIAEESRLILDIDNWVLNEAAGRSKAWSALLGRPFQISVNKSPVEFMNYAREANWGTDLQGLELTRNSISVEITEGVLLNATIRVTETLSCLQKAGIQLTIDDFGTGYASMAYLKKFDVNYLKIDQSFVRDVPSNADSRTIAETIIVMAHKLSLKVIAEGVETVEQRDWLETVDCDYAQGYLFSEPLPCQDFEKLLHRS